MFTIKSYWGVAFLALKDSQDFAMSLGISAFKYKLMVFALTSFLTGIIGAYYGHFIGVMSYRMLDLDLFSILMVMMLVGGLGHFPGSIFGAFHRSGRQRTDGAAGGLPGGDHGGAGGDSGSGASKRRHGALDHPLARRERHFSEVVDMDLNEDVTIRKPKRKEPCET
jgi:hypothetical protein